MTRRVVSFLGLLLVLSSACATVDHRADLRQAVDTMERAYGLRPEWSDSTMLRELRLDESGRLPLSEAVLMALSNNRALRADLEVIGQARAELVQAGLLPNPMLSGMLGLPESGGLPSLAFGLSEDIASIWLIPSRQRAAQAMLQQRILSLTNTAIDLVTEVRTQYAALQFQTLAANLQEENLRVLHESMEIAQARLRAGDTSQLDVNLIRSRLVESEIELLQLRNDFRVTQRTILRLLGVSAASDQWEPEPMSLEEQVPSLAASEDALIQTALLQRLDVQASRWELESAVADFEQEKLRRIQSLGIGVTGERFERRAQPGRDILADTARASIAAGTLTAPEIESVAQRRQERKQEIDYILGPSLDISLPIFDQNQAQIAKAQFRAKELQQRYEESEQRVIEGIRSAFTQRRLAEDRARSFRESLVPLQKANLQLARTTYQSGRESILTVLLAQQELIRTNLSYASAMRDLAVSAATLERQLTARIPEFQPMPVTPSSSESAPPEQANPALGDGLVGEPTILHSMAASETSSLPASENRQALKGDNS